MANIYERLLGDTYKKLHPELQKRYAITEDNSFTGEGKMDEIYGGSFFVKLILKIASKFRMFFSERGKEVPFTIHNTAERDEHGHELVRWNRTFYFHNKKRYFNAVMQLDEENNEIVDCFGEPHILVSTLNFHIDEVGAMHISSKKQWFFMFGRKIPLPRFLYGEAKIVESYDETLQCFRIHVQVRNPLIGSLFSYKGTFVERK
ncbi:MULTISPECIES: DUF4166 domain-containing protein [Bacillus]|uniref:DUF4166 domain-containing protein n=1 Tax=Bacillus TaxID=1386 RepID=UPI00032F2160|nr:hypothetical protein ICS_03846 [Bacillus cereus BAG2O-3]EOQ13672.1 hypothetical protein KQ3_01038 [Bacillus cereus B5-2]EOQ33383.1 hypothetical protein KQ1_01663 [Bacillus cereus BAG3O-1]MBJ8115064.1 DUF4166 domain-containing protein [Bacillus cereus]PFW86380.1 DUF4166 domain-containing protein [Bacillus sp. AFS075960]RFB27160.1 DUF4166 domain-containing protein [Bacillus sp. LB(2018)]RFB48055.1 DUF4166 domain-containing protein [Bacillus sp. dmp10]